MYYQKWNFMLILTQQTVSWPGPVSNWLANDPNKYRLSTVRFGAGLGTLCLNLNLHLWVRSSLLLDLNPEVWLRCGCKPGAPEVWGLNWAKYGKRSQKNSQPSLQTSGSGAGLAKIAICCTSNLNLGCGLGSHLVLQVHELDCGQSKQVSTALSATG